MTARRANAADAAGGRPPGHRLGVNSEEGRNLPGSEQTLTAVVHVPSLLQPYRLSPSVPTNRGFHPDFRKLARVSAWFPSSGRSGDPCPAGGRAVSYCGPVTDLVTEADIRAAAQRISGIVVRTPLVPFPGEQLLVKPESLQPNGSFKLRGAYAAISALGGAERRRGVVAHSSGNHAGAVALAAKLLGVPAVVVLPDNVPQVKVAAVRAAGARIVTVEPTLQARVAGTREFVERGYTLIPPF